MSIQSQNLKRYILPAILSNISFFVLTIVDGMFVGNGVGTDALGAVSFAVPYTNFVWALTVLFNVGGVAVASVRLGRGDADGANQALMHALSANFVVFSVMTVCSMLFSEEIAKLLGANETYLQMVSDYIFWYSLFLVPATLAPCLATFARNDGNPKMALMMSLSCTAANIFGDWLLVYPLQMGVAGAAIATGCANVVAFFVILQHYVRKMGQLSIHRFVPQLSLYGKIVMRGLPEMVSQFAYPITTFSMNLVLVNHLGNAAVNAYSIIIYAGSLFSSLIWGLSSGLQPLFGRSYGAKDETSLRYYIKSGQIMAFAGGILIFILTFFVGDAIGFMFGADEAAAPFVRDALPKYCLNYVFSGATAVVAAYLFSTKRTRYAISVNVARSLVLNFACINFLPLIFGYDFVWYTVAVAEGICMLMAFALCFLSERKGIVYK